MHSTATKRFSPKRATNVPLRIALICFALLDLLVAAKCGHNHNHHHHRTHSHSRQRNVDWPQTSIQEEQYSDVNFRPTGDNEPPDSMEQYALANSHKPTPHIDSKVLRDFAKRHLDANEDYISPARVFERNLLQEQPQNRGLISPLFNFQSVSPNQQQPNSPIESGQNSQPDASNLIDLIEPGSGWEAQPFDDSSVTKFEELSSVAQQQHHDSTPYPVQQGGVSSTAILDTGPSENLEHAPVLSRRIPKLAAVVGQFWRYTIPASTFVDDDGDLRKLKTSLFKDNIDDNSNETNKPQQSNNSTGLVTDDFFNWLQYDQSTQTLYGFPTESDVGRHRFNLIVANSLNLTNNEVIEISVRQHQSALAFSHSFRLTDILWNRQKYPSMVVALFDLSRRISAGVYSDQSPTNFILKSYGISETRSDPLGSPQTSGLLSFEWSNSSIPIHPCNWPKLELISKLLIDAPAFDWASGLQSRQTFPPSQGLIRALEPEFRPQSVEILMTGACKVGQSRSEATAAIDGSSLRVRMKIGKLNWKLGQIIQYKIPSEVFEADGGQRDSRNLSLNLHTVGGLSLIRDPSYRFLEFDHESQVLLGLPYDIVNHVGQRELLLTATHPVTNETAHEVFVINIERQALTVTNNYAFQISLYFLTRTSLFGPRERLALSQRVIEALGTKFSEFHHNPENSQFSIINIQKYALNLPVSGFIENLINQTSQMDRVQKVDDISDNSFDFANKDGLAQEESFLYKLSWTNETIGLDGNCPVEVINKNIIEALERTMLEHSPDLDEPRSEEARNDSMIFYDRLRSFFGPDYELLTLRFEPTNACMGTMEIHDAGNSYIADQIDALDIADKPIENHEQEVVLPPAKPPPSSKIEEQYDSSFNNDEYWSIVVLIVLVVALIFVMMVFFMALHTYKINQEKRLELQLKLAQARQNSMYLSSMMLADQAGQLIHSNSMMKPPANLQTQHDNEERASRKPVILDNEKQLWTNGQLNQLPMFRQTAAQLYDQTVHTMPLRPNMTFTLDSIASSMQTPSMNSMIVRDHSMYYGDKRRSMTLNRRIPNANGRQQHSQQQQAAHTMHNRLASMGRLNHSQSILTVTSLATPVHLMPQQSNLAPMICAPLPVVCESSSEIPRDSM